MTAAASPAALARTDPESARQPATRGTRRPPEAAAHRRDREHESALTQSAQLSVCPTAVALTRPRAPVCRERSGRSPQRARRFSAGPANGPRSGAAPCWAPPCWLRALAAHLLHCEMLPSTRYSRVRVRQRSTWMPPACSHVPKPLMRRFRCGSGFAAVPPQAMDVQPNATHLMLATTVLPFLLPPSHRRCAHIYWCAVEQVFERRRCSLLAA